VDPLASNKIQRDVSNNSLGKQQVIVWLSKNKIGMPVTSDAREQQTIEFSIFLLRALSGTGSNRQFSTPERHVVFACARANQNNPSMWVETR
jgi:hypothetical protein